jgi:hypothetical protein
MLQSYEIIYSLSAPFPKNVCHRCVKADALTFICLEMVAKMAVSWLLKHTVKFLQHFLFVFFSKKATFAKSKLKTRKDD